MAIKINTEQCTGCGACVEVCPVQAIKITNGKAVIDWILCMDCGACVTACPQHVIQRQ